MAVKKKAIIIPTVIALLAGGGLYACNALSSAAKESMMANSKYSNTDNKILIFFIMKPF